MLEIVICELKWQYTPKHEKYTTEVCNRNKADVHNSTQQSQYQQYSTIAEFLY